jgi:imidazolonepropionase-like amidohydrolase
LVADAKIRLAQGTYDTTIDATGKHVYPGFIAPNSTLGLVEIDAVKSSDDESEIEISTLMLEVCCLQRRVESNETVRPNGILIAQITLEVVLYQASVVHLDSWNWKMQ